MADSQIIAAEIAAGTGAILASGTALAPVVSTAISTPLLGSSLVAATQTGTFVSMGAGLGTTVATFCPPIAALVGGGLIVHGIYQAVKK